METLTYLARLPLTEVYVVGGTVVIVDRRQGPPRAVLTSDPAEVLEVLSPRGLVEARAVLEDLKRNHWR